jgi:hypothetical protein
MEPEGSSPCLQEPATAPYPKPVESSQNPHTPAYFFETHAGVSKRTVLLAVSAWSFLCFSHLPHPC